MILANTEELHDKIESLLERIRLLEDALKTLQSSVSTQPHPLLLNTSVDLLLPAVPIARAQDDSHAVHRRALIEEEEVALLDAFGTLSIGSDGETHYLGQTARADDSDSEDCFEFGRLPREFYSYTWPEAPPPDGLVDENVLGYLPDLNEAYSLCEVYLSYAGWLGLFVSRKELYEDFIAHVYHLPNRPWADTIETCPHRLALLFAIFSLGALFDPARPPYNPESDDYYHLARVSLSFKSAVLETTVHAVLAIMGLHRNSVLWKLDEEISERRHSTFWQLYVMETIAILQDAFGVNTPSYSAILALDRQVRDFGEPQWPSLQYAFDSQQAPPLMKMQHWNILQIKETVLLHLHRSFLIEALSDEQEDPLKSDFSQSLKACFESAYKLIEGLNWINAQCPEISLMRCPTSEYARPAMEKLDNVYVVLQKASNTNRTAQKNVGAIRRLRNIARAALDASRLRVSRGPLPPPQAFMTSTDDSNALERSCGKTQVRVRHVRAPCSGPVSGLSASEEKNVRSSFSQDRRPGVNENWDGRSLSFSSGEDSALSLGSSSSCAIDFSRLYGLSGNNLYPAGSQRLDPTWHNFIQQLGF
ncbi:hypothetical protein EW145_g4510 [Phellinidium pouzarii]|uniref:Transcription factor domain-containing protein n=1 Tax=Phellinidium pouzarii TaxID=167371 RepID=A0A4S4L3F1_9AGAM|nr:hypothetical protein EW145_g4510 [Phellinidium pouzarii]